MAQAEMLWRMLGRSIADTCPRGTAYALLVKEARSPAARYLSNAHRGDVARTIVEWLDVAPTVGRSDSGPRPGETEAFYASRRELEHYCTETVDGLLAALDPETAVRGALIFFAFDLGAGGRLAWRAEGPRLAVVRMLGDFVAVARPIPSILKPN
jgi:hypothetical protein